MGAAVAAALFLVGLVGLAREWMFLDRGTRSAERAGSSEEVANGGIDEVVVVRESGRAVEGFRRKEKESRTHGDPSGVGGAGPDGGEAGGGKGQEVREAAVAAAGAGTGTKSGADPETEANDPIDPAGGGRIEGEKKTIVAAGGAENEKGAIGVGGSGETVPAIPEDAVFEPQDSTTVTVAQAPGEVADGDRLKRPEATASDRTAGLRVDAPRTCPRGDVNGDGRVDIADSMLITRGLLRRDRRVDLSNGDANGDGRVDIADSMAISNRVVAAAGK